MIKLFHLISLIISLNFAISAQPYDRITELINDKASEGAQFGISVADTDGTFVFEYLAESKMIPASTLKLITTLSAIELLGEDYFYELIIGYKGDILADGTLIGNLIIVGSGDPSLGSPEFEGTRPMKEVLHEIVDIVHDKGITCIDGKILVDDWIFDNRPIHPSWSWDDLTNYYASGAWGLNLHENLYFLSFERSKSPGQPTSILSVEPELPGYHFGNEVLTGPLNSGDNAYIYGNPYDLSRWISGTIPPGKGLFVIKGAIADPADFAAYQIHQSLAESGIVALDYGRTIEKSQNIQRIGMIGSPSLKILTAYANEVSNNLYCEAFLRTVGTLSGEQGSFSTGIDEIKKHLKALFLNVDGLQQEDGSGLSSRNRISANFMSSFINSKRRSLGDEELKSLIPKAGVRGSVRNFLSGFESQNYCWMKSGSINNVLAYAGLLECASGRVVSVSIMANGHNSNRNVRGQIEKIIEVLYKEV